MNIIVGTTNKAKIAAVEELLQEYPDFKESDVEGKSVASGVGDQPRSLKETIEGAMNRAKAAFEACDYSIGIESGLMEVPYTKTGYMDICVAAIYDGKEIHLGLSSAWECPPEVTRLIMEEGLDMTQAANKVGLSQNPALGSHEGLLGIMTKGRILRKEYTKQALAMALIQLENDVHYKR